MHLWLGLVSGFVVFVVCLSAAVWAFRPEIERITLGHQWVAVQQAPYRSPSLILQQARAYLKPHAIPITSISGIFYGKNGRSASVRFKQADASDATLYLNPYNGEVLHLETVPHATGKFMLFLRAGHRFLWLPPAIGSPIVGISCLIFMITLITGIVWWYPPKWNRSTRQKSFKIKWQSGWKRLNIDLHNVFGFYIFLVAIVLSITGVYYSFDWFRYTYHRLLTGKVKIGALYPYEVEVPGSKQIGQPVTSGLEDIIWAKVADLHGKCEINIVFPQEASASYALYINPDNTQEGYYYRMYARYFDQYSGQELFAVKGSHKLFADAGIGEKIFRANYELHVGSIGGFGTRVIASFVSLIGASLPITGFIIWYNRKWGKRSRKRS